MHRFLGFILTIALIGLVLIWLLAGGTEQASSAGPAVSSELSGAGDRGAVDEESAGALARAEAVQNAIEDPQAPLQPAASPESQGVRLLVVRREDGSPVPDAEVLWHPVSQEFRHPRAQEYLMEKYDWVGFARLLCSEAMRTDATGHVTLPVSRYDHLHVTGLGEGYWGSTMVEQAFQREETTLVLYRESELAIRVVDESGQPVVGARVGWESESLGESRAPNVWQWWTTDEKGLARLERLTPEQMGEPAPLGLSRWVVLLEPFEPRIRVRWNFDQPPEQPILLRMPRHGSVVVEAKDSSGDAASDGTDVFLSAASWGWPPGSRGRGRELEGGRCLFPFVGLDTDFIAAADVEEFFRFATVRGRGPQVAGEMVTMSIEPSVSGDVLTGRIITQAGIPADREWRLSLMIVLANDEDRGAFGGTMRLRADGGFTIAVRKEWREYQGKALLVLNSNVYPAGQLDVACAELPWPPRPGTTDLGELACGAELLVAGRVVDAWGQPREGVRLSVCRTVTGEDGRPRHSELDGSNVTTDEVGRFRFSGNWPASADRIFIRLGGMFGQKIEGPSFRRGQQDLLITLPSSTTARGQVLSDAVIQNREIAIQAKAAPVTGGPEQEFNAAIKADGTFSLVNLPAGRFSISLRGWNPAFELTGLASLTLGSLQEESPPELNPIDLRGKLQYCEITARTSDSGPLSSATFSLDAQNFAYGSRTYELPATIAVPIGYMEPANCWVEGYAPAAVDWSLPVQEIVLEPLPRIQFRITGLPARADEYNTVEILLTQMGAADKEPWRRAFRLTSGMQIQAWVPEPGSYALELRLLQGSLYGSSAIARVTLGAQPDFTVTVPAGGLDEEVILEVTSAALGAALQALRKD